jgi:hypothetical protein
MTSGSAFVERLDALIEPLREQRMETLRERSLTIGQPHQASHEVDGLRPVVDHQAQQNKTDFRYNIRWGKPSHV